MVMIYDGIIRNNTMSKTTNEKLLEIMARNRYTCSNVASLLHVDVGTVARWRVDPGKSSYRAMPRGLLELLEYKQDIRE